MAVVARSSWLGCGGLGQPVTAVDAGFTMQAANHNGGVHRRGASQGSSSDALGLRFDLPTCAILQLPARFPPSPCPLHIVSPVPLLPRPTANLCLNTRS
jgi:hypothetical protein